MSQEKERTPRSKAFSEAIANFIAERRDAKVKGGTDDQALLAKYDYATWLADAARRVGQIQAVTHVLKATHPDARGSSVHAAPATLIQHSEVGTHSLGEDYADDIVGNAAALDVYKFLKLEIDGRRLLDCLLDDDPDLRAALSDDDALAQEWASAFKGLVRPATSYSSHGLAKQLYWCVTGEPSKDEDFHLLQPSFSSALAHAVHADISDARFGEANVQARQAMRSKEACASDYRDYRGLVARKLGGTKPQNISQLNSERGGVNYLLASLPPRWDQDQPRQFLGIQSALDRFRRYEGVSSLVTALCHFLASNPDPTMETRVERERIEQALGTSLAAFGLTVQGSFVPGWTRDENCRLSHCQKLWLDPGRAELPPRSEHKDEDDAFACDFTRQDWPDEVAMQFGNWLNDILERRGLPVGTVEYTHWVKQAIVDVTEWPATMQRRPIATQEEEGAHV